MLKGSLLFVSVSAAVSGRPQKCVLMRLLIGPFYVPIQNPRESLQSSSLRVGIFKMVCGVQSI